MRSRREYIVPHPAVIEAARAPCTRCGGRMWLSRIAPTSRGHELRSFECSKCSHVDHYAVVYGSDVPWVRIGGDALPPACASGPGDTLQ